MTAPPEAVNAIVGAGLALKAALRAIGEPSARAAAMTSADQAELLARTAEDAADLLSPAATLQRRALIGAAEAAEAAAQVARAAGALLPPGQVTPTALWRALSALGERLQTALALAPAPVRDRLLAEVLSEQLLAEQDWARLVASLAPRCLGPGRTELVMAGRDLLHGSTPDFSRRRLQRARASRPVPPERVTAMTLAADVHRLREIADAATPAGRAVHAAGPATRPPGAPPTGTVGFATEDLEALWRLLALTSMALKTLKTDFKGKETRGTRAEWNEWMRAIHDGKEYHPEIRVEMGGRDDVLRDVLGWVEVDTSRDRTVSDTVRLVAGEYVHALFDELFSRVDVDRQADLFQTKETLLAQCVAIQGFYRSRR